MVGIKLCRRIAIGLMLLFQAHAYNVTDDFQSGAYWQNFPIQLVKFATSNIEDPILTSLVEQAKLSWEAAVGREIWDVPEEYFFNNSGNNIRWSYNFSQETGFSDVTTLAVTIRYRVGNSIERVEVILNGNNSFLRANQNNMLYQTILHELGHVVGLGHSEYFNAVMAANLSGVNSLHNDDVEGINFVTEQTLVRQQNGGATTNSLNSDNDFNAANVAGCGTIDLDQGGGNGPGGFFLTIILGFMAVTLLKTREKSTIFQRF